MSGPASANWWPKLLLVALFAGVIVAFFALGGNRYVTIDAMKANRDALLAFTDQHFAAALAIAFVVYASAVAFSLPVGTAMSIAAGFLFGRWMGTALVAVAATTGATLVFLAARYLFADAAHRRAGALGERIVEGFTADAFNYLLFLRLVPLFPFFLVNLAPAFTAIKLRTYVMATFIGIIPGAFVYVNLGRALGSIDASAQLVSPQTLGALALIGVLALTPILLRKRHRAAGAAPPP